MAPEVFYLSGSLARLPFIKCELPCDITFEILGNSFSGSNGEKKTVIGEIGAHKCFLALCSDVFKVSRLGECFNRVCRLKSNIF